MTPWNFRALRLLLLLFAAGLSQAGFAAATRDFIRKPAAWYATEEAKTVAANILSYQSELGGWPKNLDLTAAPFTGKPGELVGDLKPIFDNGATTDEVRFMARMYRATGEARYLHAVEDALDFIVIAQYANGGWPQSYPPDAMYHRFITFNDDAMVRLMLLLQEIGDTDGFSFLDADRRRAVRSAMQRGIDCILKCQIRVDGRLTAWCAQHDEMDLRPREGRAFEPLSISGAESVRVVKFLMSLERPGPEVVRAIEGAVGWFRAAQITGWKVIEQRAENGGGKNFESVKDASAPPLWARFYQVGTNEPIFCDRDSVLHVGIENSGWARHGYRWTGDWPRPLLEKDYPKWKAKLGKTGIGPALAPWQPRVRIALVGDSTVKDGGGWGFGFKKRLGADVLCENFAQGGQSSLSFRDSGLWQRALAAKPAYVLIQFGHNDMPGKGPKRETDPATTFAANLARYVAEAREAGAQPILVTSLTRRNFQPDGKVRHDLESYAGATRKIAAEQKVPLIDLYAKSVALVEKLGPSGVEPLEPMILPKKATVELSTEAPVALPQPEPPDLDNPAHADEPHPDKTHLSARGSLEFGEMVAGEMRRLLPETSAYFRKPD